MAVVDAISIGFDDKKLYSAEFPGEVGYSWCFLEILHQFRLVVYLIIYKDLYIPGGC